MKTTRDCETGSHGSNGKHPVSSGNKDDPKTPDPDPKKEPVEADSSTKDETIETILKASIPYSDIDIVKKAPG